MTTTQPLELDAWTLSKRKGGFRLAPEPIVAGLASGAVLWTAFPPVEWSWLAWVGLVPLLWLAVQQSRSLESTWAPGPAASRSGS